MQETKKLIDSLTRPYYVSFMGDLIQVAVQPVPALNLHLSLNSDLENTIYVRLPDVETDEWSRVGSFNLPVSSPEVKLCVVAVKEFLSLYKDTTVVSNNASIRMINPSVVLAAKKTQEEVLADNAL